MLARFVGGPMDGKAEEIGGYFDCIDVRYGDPPPGPERTPWFNPQIARYRRTPWTRDGARLYVVEGHDRSLIGDEEIDAAARWLAARQCEHSTPAMAGDAEHLGRGLAEHHAVNLRRYRESAPVSPLALTLPTVAGPIFGVRVEPGCAEGFRQPGIGQPIETVWRWPEVDAPAAAD